jgi:hypothetical protein
MPIFTKYLTAEGFNKSVNTLSDYMAGVLACLQGRVGGEPLYRTRVPLLNTRMSDWLGQRKLGPRKTEKMVALGGEGDQFIQFADQLVEETINAVLPAPPRAPQSISFAQIPTGKLVYGSTRVQGLISADANIKTKIASVYSMGKTYTGHGPTVSLGIGALHCHVGNGDGIGFKWVADVLHILAWGQKSDSAGAGTSGYKWTT